MAPYENKHPARTTMLPFEYESEEEYISALLADISKYADYRNKHFNCNFYALSYPGGQFKQLSEKVINNAGISVTVTSDTDTRNIIVQRLPQTLYDLIRWNKTEKTTPHNILSILQNTEN